VPVELTCRAVSGRPYTGALRADVLTLLGILALEHCELSLMLVSDSGIRRLNREFRGKDQATDVLSFPQIEADRELKQRRGASTPDAPPLAIGDIVISIDTARRQARELGQAAAARIRTLLIHGMLHLLGYDHERSLAEARRMFAREHELAALMDDAGGRQPRPHLSKGVGAQGRKVSPQTPCENVSRETFSAAHGTKSPAKGQDAASDLRWSPTAMPERLAKAVKKSAGRSKPKAKAGARVLSP
jgi:probable rRNA maturation factor